MPADALFDPPGPAWTTVSPRLAVVRRGLLAAVVLVLTVGAGVAAGLVGGVRPAAVTVLVGVVLAAIGWRMVGRRVAGWGYAERDDDLLVRSGVLARRLVVVPYGRMQFVDVTAGPIDRLAGVATLRMHTAAATSDVVIPGLVPPEAARLRDQLAARGEARGAGL